MVFEAGGRVSPLLTAGTGKIGLRVSGHPVPCLLVESLGAPITGTSANISDRPPCRHAEEVLKALGEDVNLVLDGGETPGEAASTVLDVTVDPPRILREGLIRRKELEAIIPVHAS